MRFSEILAGSVPRERGGGLCPWGSLSGASLSSGVSVWGVSVMETPPYGNERAVCILLECILVQSSISTHLISYQKQSRHDQSYTCFHDFRVVKVIHVKISFFKKIFGGHKSVLWGR